MSDSSSGTQIAIRHEEESMNQVKPLSFARYGSEKMFFDSRMGPQALHHNEVIYIVYQANEQGIAAHPHMIAYNCITRSWSKPVKLGENPAEYDHHFAPILWIDANERLHVLYGCHLTPGTHLVSRKPREIEEWEEGPPIAKSISYPTVVQASDNRHVLFYRALGHLGFWNFRVSNDGGFSWSSAKRLIDFDRDPRDDNDADSWAGSYPSVSAGVDGRSLHIGFVYFDERKRKHPFYTIRPRSRTRYNLYYLRLDIDSGEIYNIDGDKVATPVNRGQAERTCLVWDTGHELSNMPSVTIDQQNNPYFLLPVSDQSPWRSRFYFVARRNGKWERVPLIDTNNTWAGCLLQADGLKNFIAYMVSGDPKDETLFYSGGLIEKWHSGDGGVTWHREQVLVPEPGLLYSNPKPVHRSGGGYLKDHVLFFGWNGPGSIEADASPLRNRGRAYLWANGQWL